MTSFYKIFSTDVSEKFMEITFTFEADIRKPVFNCLQTVGCGEFRCMLDSGASIPVWYLGEEQLAETFPEAKLESQRLHGQTDFGQSDFCCLVGYIFGWYEQDASYAGNNYGGRV